MERLHDRMLAAEDRFWDTGRFAEYADEMAALAHLFGREKHMPDTLEYVMGLRVARCEGLVRAGQAPQAEREADAMRPWFAAVEGEDGPQWRRLRARMAAAHRGDETVRRGWR